MPALKKFQEQHSNINLLAVDVAGNAEQAKSYLASRRLTDLRVAVTNGFPQQFGLEQTPSTIVMDSFGQIQFVHAGMLADVRAILGKDLESLPGAR